MVEAGVDGVPMVGVAKGPNCETSLELLHVRPDRFVLKPESPGLYECHPLDEIDSFGGCRNEGPGPAGPGREAGCHLDLSKVERVCAALAQRICDHVIRGEG